MIYRRMGSPKYQMRLKIPNKSGYVIQSTKERDVLLAEDFARKSYASLTYKIENNLDIGTYNFEKFYKTWWKRERPSKSPSRISYIEGTFRRYFIPYFTEVLSNKSITTLTDMDFEDYWNWRINYWVSEEGQENLNAVENRKNNLGNQRHSKKGNVKKSRPADKSLYMEQSLLKQIFWWGHRRGIVHRQPYIKAPRDAAQKNLRTARRPTFELDEWRKLYRHMRKWVNSKNVGELNRKGGRYAKTRKGYTRAHSLHIFQRNLIRNYILFMANSGMRPNEARQMRWGDIRVNPQGHKFIYVRATTKTGFRETIPLPHAFKYLDRIKEQSEFTAVEDLVFANREGKSVENFGKTFKKLLTDTNLLLDDEGRTRTIYSLRHFYCTQRLLSKTKPMPMEVLAQNVGTSPTMMFTHYRHLEVHNYADVLVSR